MVKYVHIIIGIVLFSLFTTLVFTSTALIGSDHNSKTSDDFSTLAGEYDEFVDEGSEANSTLRQMEDKISGESTLFSVGADIIGSAVEAVKLFVQSLTTVGTVTDMVEEDSGGRIHPLFSVAIKSIIGIIFIVIVISMLMRFKPET